MQGKTVLITGATGGIGEAVSRRLSARGYSLALHYHQQVEKAHALADELRERSGESVLPFQADLSTPEGVARLADNVAREMGTPFGFVFNAGILKEVPFSLTSPTLWNATLNLDLTAAALLTQAFSRALLRRKSGSLVYISSVSGLLGAPFQAPYAAAKSGLHGLVRSLAREWGRSNITINAIAPGYIETPMTEKLSPEQRAARTVRIPLARFGTPAAIADAAAFLLSETYITGQILAVDGGLSLN